MFLFRMVVDFIPPSNEEFLKLHLRKVHGMEWALP